MRRQFFALTFVLGSAAGAQAPAAAATAPRRADPAPTAVRALYVNRWATQSKKRMAKLIAAADETEINAFVLDMKDEFGLNYKTSNPEFGKNAGTATKANVAALLDTLKAHKILPIARIVVFKDSVTARVHPEWTIRRNDGSIWRDKKGIAWVNPYHHELWDYNIGVAEELVKMGFGEVQFDYIRFPEPYKSLPPQVFPGSNNLSKPDAIAAYLKEAKARINKLGVRSTADIFGLVTTVIGPLEVAQHWERVSPQRRRGAADGVPVALPARRAGDLSSKRRAVQGRVHRDLEGARTRQEARHHGAGARAPVATSLLARAAAIRRRTARGAEEGRVRRGL